jgi:glycosyltransferase involved in cell wall biosynthesis
MSDRPLVSILMCTYNGRDFIEAAVADIVDQTYSNWELVISDDGSSDGTREWLQQLGDDERIRVILQPHNLGYVDNKNFALAQAKGALITQQDQDDRSSPERLERQVAALQEYGLEIAACGFRRVTGDGRVAYEVGSAEDRVIHEKGSGDYPFWFPALMASRRVYDAIGDYSTYFAGAFGDDLYWTVRANEQFPIICLKDKLYTYTDAPASITSLLDNPRKLIMGDVLKQLIEQRRAQGMDDLEQGRVEALERLEKRLLGNRAYLSRRYQLYAARSIDQRRYPEAAKLLRKALALAPWRLSLVRTLIYYMRMSRT